MSPGYGTPGPQKPPHLKLDLPVPDEGYGTPLDSPAVQFDNAVGVIVFPLSELDITSLPDTAKYHVVDSPYGLQNVAESIKNAKTQKLDPDSKGFTVVANRKNERRKSNEEKKILAKTNCQPSDQAYIRFRTKHLQKVRDDNTNPGMTSWLASNEKRVSDPVIFSTIFLTAKQDLDYSFEEGKCYAEEPVETFTCVRDPNNDAFEFCVSLGQCFPSFQHSDGHFVPPKCLPNTQNHKLDFAASELDYNLLQKQFTSGHFKKLPVYDHQKDLMVYYEELHDWKTGSKETAKPEIPKKIWSEREQLYSNYAKKEGATTRIPEEILQLYFRQPYWLYDQDMLRKDPWAEIEEIKPSLFNRRPNPSYKEPPNVQDIRVRVKNRLDNKTEYSLISLQKEFEKLNEKKKEVAEPVEKRWYPSRLMPDTTSSPNLIHQLDKIMIEKYRDEL